MVYKTTGKKSEQRKTFNLRIAWVDDSGELRQKRFFTKIQAAAELGISYTSICRKLKGMNVPKYAHLQIDAIREPAWTPSVQLLC
tara:strand:- start:2780 stop:3034 length:255 start_codon:yes stop_codon:yes gene_type:complete